MKDKVENKIRELVPELMDLSRGAVVRQILYKKKREGKSEIEATFDYTIHEQNYRFDGERFHENGYVVYKDTTTSYPLFEERQFDVMHIKEETEFSDWKIIGHPIHLEDVLRAVNEKGKSLNFSQLGEVFQIVNGERDYKVIYDLTKPFSEQSPDLYKFLAEVLEV